MRFSVVGHQNAQGFSPLWQIWIGARIHLVVISVQSSLHKEELVNVRNLDTIFLSNCIHSVN